MKTTLPTNLPRTLAQALSLLCHPLTMVVWLAFVTMFGFVGKFTYPAPLRWYVVGTVTFMTVVVPCLFMLLLRIFGVSGSGEGGAQRTRIMMLVAVAVCYTCCGWVFDDIVVLYLVRKMLYTATAVVALLLLFELFYPLDCHTTAMGSLLGMMWVLLLVGNVSLLIPFIICVALVGALATARLYLTECRIGSLAWGALLGFALSAVLLVVI